MSILSWLNVLRIGARSEHPPGNPRGKLERRRLFLEGLEERRLLTFVPAVDYPTGPGPQAIVSADLNGDGDLDLVTANSGSTVSVLLGNGQGGFGAASHLAVGSNPSSVAVGDFNSDGNLDLVVANGGSYDVSILHGDGEGAFGTAASVPIGGSPASVAVGDFNDDGSLDLGVVSNHSSYYGGYYGYYYYGYYYQGYAHVLLGNGGGEFLPTSSTWLGYGYHSSSAVADFDGDGIDDLATANSDYSYVDLLLSDGAGGILGQAYLGTGYYPRAIAAGDVDGDGDTDLVTANYTDISVLLADGAGGYGAPESYPASNYPTSVALGDVDGDGSLDIATTKVGGNSVAIFRARGDGSGTFAPAEDFAAGHGAYALATGDFNGDGAVDVATANLYANSVSVLINDQAWGAAPDSLTISDVSVTERDTGVVSAVFTVTRHGSLAGTTTVSYGTANGGALAGSDYVAASGTLTLAPGEATRTFAVSVNGDVIDEWDQAFVVNLSAVSGAVITDGQAFGTILDDDAEPTITITPIVSAKEGNNGGLKLFNFVVTLSAPSEKDVWVSFATNNGTATTADGDYIARSGTLYFAAGTTSKTISIQVRGDKKREATERFTVNLSGAMNATPGLLQGIGEIVDDDSPSRK